MFSLDFFFNYLKKPSLNIYILKENSSAIHAFQCSETKW